MPLALPAPATSTHFPARPVSGPVGALNWEQIREVAHAYKGEAENLGAHSIAERCSQIMRASDEVLAREQSKLVTDLAAQLTAVTDASRHEVARLSRSGRGKDVPDVS